MVGDHHQVALLAVGLDVFDLEVVDRHPDLPRHADEQVGERQAVGPALLEHLGRRAGVSPDVLDGDLLPVEEALAQVAEPGGGRQAVGCRLVSPGAHLVGQLEGQEDLGRIEPDDP